MANHSHQSTNTVLALLLSCAPALGCATAQPPQELLDARAAYTRAEGGYARELSPASLHNAKTALDGAERSFSSDGDSPVTRDQSYVALRKAELADAEGATMHYQRELQATKQRSELAQAKQAEKTQEELAQTRQQLTQEQSARKMAEQKAQEALERLTAANAAAAVKKEPRGTVITLSGNVLFASGKSEILPGAQMSLGQVADALKDQDNAKLLVEGHTDSRGSEQTNLMLSKARADAVGSFLISRGISANRVTTQGIGPSRPVADNNTAEGRANNRRVEIIVQNEEPH
jgi:outer membrane protein OmpA-like peptidoglycan-associated protein